MAPSRQERRKAERVALKRAQAGNRAEGAAGAAAALANLNVNPLGHWTTQAENPAVGPGRYWTFWTSLDSPTNERFRVLKKKQRVTPAWPYSSVLFEALGAAVVKQGAAKGDAEAQFSLGSHLVCKADGGVAPLGSSGRSPRADVGLALCTAQFPVARQTETGRCDHPISTDAHMHYSRMRYPGHRRAWRFWRRRPGKGTCTL